MLVDTHAHLNFKAFDKDLDQVIDRAKKTGVEKIIIPGAKIDSSAQAIAIADKYPGCYASVGVHPHHADEVATLIHNSIKANDIKAQLSKLIKNNKVIAVGEIGLDYHQYKNYPSVSQENKSWQKELFTLQLDLAAVNNLPVIIHCRESFSDLLFILGQQIKQKELRGVFHCFSGSQNDLLKVLTMGFYIGFDGNTTYPENSHLRRIIKKVPLDRLLIETDSPYLTPVPFRGKRNEPAYIKYLIESIAQIYNKSIEEITLATSRNANSLFRI